MDEELLEQLRKASFPYITSPSNRFGYSWSNSDQLSIPDLSTLIETCEKFNFEIFGIHKDVGSKNKDWLAWVDNRDHHEEVKAFGESPEEAVANLWLKLNK